MQREKLFRFTFRKTGPYLYVLPTIIVFGIIVAYPFINGIVLSFFDYNFLRLKNYFVGLANYRFFLFEDEHFWRVMWNTFRWTALGIAITYVSSLLVALLLNVKLRFSGVFQALLLIPWVVPPVMAGVIWTSFYDPNFGLLNFVLTRLGLIAEPHAWLGEKNFALLSVLAITVWKYSPFYIIALLAGLKAIPGQVYEAAELDGANAIQKFLYITFPILAPVTRVVLVLGVVWKATHFDLVWMLTQGGPGYYSHLASTYSYTLAILRLEAGKGATVAVLLTVFLALFITYFARQAVRSRLAP